MTLFRHSNKLLVKDKTFTIDHKNIKQFGIEMHKAVNNLPGGNLIDFFCKKKSQLQSLL